MELADNPLIRRTPYLSMALTSPGAARKILWR
jgi:hypothetical protein